MNKNILHIQNVDKLCNFMVKNKNNIDETVYREIMGLVSEYVNYSRAIIDIRGVKLTKENSNKIYYLRIDIKKHISRIRGLLSRRFNECFNDVVNKKAE